MLKIQVLCGARYSSPPQFVTITSTPRSEPVNKRTDERTDESGNERTAPWTPVKGGYVPNALLHGGKAHG